MYTWLPHCSTIIRHTERMKKLWSYLKTLLGIELPAPSLLPTRGEGRTAIEKPCPWGLQRRVSGCKAQISLPIVSPGAGGIVVVEDAPGITVVSVEMLVAQGHGWGGVSRGRGGAVGLRSADTSQWRGQQVWKRVEKSWNVSYLFYLPAFKRSEKWKDLVLQPYPFELWDSPIE